MSKKQRSIFSLLVLPAASNVPVGQVRPLQKCPICGYVLANSGKCENNYCQEKEKQEEEDR